MSELRQALVDGYLKNLKLPGIRAEYAQLARQAKAAEWPYEEYLRELLERELRRREQSVAGQRLREAHFADIKTLEQIDWSAMEGVSRKTILELASCAFIEKTEDVVIAGPIGTGKSHLGIALGGGGDQAALSGAVFVKAADLARISHTPARKRPFSLV